MALSTSTSLLCYYLCRCLSRPASEMSDEKLSGVLQQLVSAGKPSFADILSSNPPTNHPSLLSLFEVDTTDSELKFVFLGQGPFTQLSPSPCVTTSRRSCAILARRSLLSPIMIGQPNSAVYSMTRLFGQPLPCGPIIRRDYSYTCTKLWYLVTDRLCINTITSNGIVNFYVAALLLFMSPLVETS